MKKRIKSIFIGFLIINFFVKITSVYALSVSKNNVTIDNGKSDVIELYANNLENVSKVNFTLVFTTYDIEADFIVDSKYNVSIDGTKYSVTFDEEKSGNVLLGKVVINVKSDPNELSGNVNIHSVTAINSDDEVINLDSQVINVNVNMVTTTEVTTTKEATTTAAPSTTKATTKKKEEVATTKKDETNGNSLLLKIDSKLTSIDIKDDVYEYVVYIPSDVTELDLEPVSKDEESKIEITSQKISELKDNKIIITVSNGDKKEEYIINVKIKQKEEKRTVTIDNSEFVGDKSYKKKWFIVLFGSAILLICSALFMKKK